MSQGTRQDIDATKQDLLAFNDLSHYAKSNLTKLAAWISDRNIPFLVCSIGMVVMLLWAGSYKMTAPGAEGIIPLVSNSPLTWWHFKLFGPYVGSDIIGLTEWTAAILILAGYVMAQSRYCRRTHHDTHVLYNQYDDRNYPRHAYCDSRDEVHDVSRPVPFQGRDSAGGIVLSDQLFRPEGCCFRAKEISKQASNVTLPRSDSRGTLLAFHSLRSACIGSTAAARRAGRYDAANPAASSTSVTAAMVHGSCGRTP